MLGSTPNQANQIYAFRIGAGDIDLVAQHIAVVPEPETCAMLMAGLGLVGWVGARRRRGVNRS